MLFNRLKRTLPLLLMIALFVAPLSACQKNVDPLAKSGFSSLKIDKKNHINAEITLDTRTLQAHNGQAIFLYELSPDEDLSALSTKEPLDSARVTSLVTLSTDLMVGEQSSRLYSRFFAVFSDGSLLSPDGFWIENPEKLASNTTPFPWSSSPKGISMTDINLAVALGSRHVMLNVTDSELLTNADGQFEFNGNAFPISNTALLKLDEQVLDAAKAGTQISLTLCLSDTTSRGQAVALIDLLASRYSTQDSGTVTALFLDAADTAKLTDVTLLCRVANLALRSRVANARLYAVSDFSTVTETKTFFSNLRLHLSVGGKISWGAAVRPVCSDQPWKEDTSDTMTVNRLGELSNFLFFESNDTNAAWLALCGVSYSSQNPDEQAVSFAYTYCEAVAATASLIYYDITSNDVDLFTEDGEARRIASVFSDIDVGLSQEDALLFQKITEDDWSKKSANVRSRNHLTGIASVGSSGFEEKMLFEFTEDHTHGFTSVNGTAPLILNSTAWNAPVLSTWIDPLATTPGGLRTVIKDGTTLEGVISLSTWILTAQAGDATECTVRLTLEGEAKNRQRLTYSSDLAVAHGEWQLITFQIADFVADADLSRPIHLMLTTTPNQTPDEDFVFYVKDVYVRSPQTNRGTLLPALSIVACVGVSTVVMLLIYKRASRKRI